MDAFNFSSDFPSSFSRSPGRPASTRLKNLAEELQDQIELLPGVKAADISGVREREIRVEIDLPRLIAYDMPAVAGHAAASPRRTRPSRPATSRWRDDKFQVRIPGEFRLVVASCRDILLAERGGRPVYLLDVATVARHVQGRRVDLAAERAAERFAQREEARRARTPWS